MNLFIIIIDKLYIILNCMNPLLNRLFEDRSKSKSKRTSLQRQEHNRSVDKVLVPKIPTRLRLDSLPQPFLDKKKSNGQRVYVGQLPSITLKTQELKEAGISRPNFRNRKLSSSIRDMEGNFFSTQFGQNPTVTEYDVEQSIIKQPTKTRPFQLPTKDYAKPQQNEQQLFQYLKVIENNEELSQQFCYMNRKDLPYSYYIVDYEDRNRHQYLTVSLRGITCYKQEEQSEFYTIKKFKRQIQEFKNVKKIPFFKNYILIKVMAHWKEKMIRKKFNLKCKYITTHLFSQNLIIQEYLHFLHSLGQDYSGGNFFNFPVTITRTLQQFKELAEHGCKDFLKSIKKFDNIIQKQLHSVLEKLMHKFRTDERVTIGSADKKRQDEAYLPFDSKHRSMKYTQMAKLKDFEGSMYRLIKYTDMFRFNTKVALIRKCYQNSTLQLKGLKKAFENKETIRFTNWIYVNVALQEKDNQGAVVVEPSLNEISNAIIHLKDHILKQIFRDHRLLAEKKDEMFCENIQFEDEEHPSKFQLKYFIIKNQQFQMLDQLLLISLRDITDSIQSLIHKYETILLQIYHKNVIKTGIEEYLDNSTISKYLASYRAEYDIVQNYEDIVQYALAVLKITDLKDNIRKSAQNKFKTISNSVPGEVIKRCEELQISIRNVHSKFKENPYTVQQYITFYFNYQQSKHKILEMQAKLQKLLQFQEIVYKNGIRIGQTAKSSISECQTLFKQLSKRAEEIESNEQNDRKKFQNMVEEMIPMIQDKAEQMLKQLHSDTTINSASSDLQRSLAKLANLEQSFQKIKGKKQQLFSHQIQMKLGHRQMEMFDKLQLSMRYMHQIWQSRSFYFKVQEFIKVTGYGHVNELSLQPLLSFVNNCENYSIVLECYELLQDFKQQTSNLLKIIKLSQLVSAETLQHEHLEDLKRVLKSPSNLLNIDHMFSKDNKNKITCLQVYTDTNANQIEHEINEIVFMSAQESVVKNQLIEIQEYWRKSKIKLVAQDIAQNQIPISHLDINEDIQQTLGYYLVMLKNIEGSSHIIGIAKDRASINGKICNYLRQFLWKWAQVEKEWIKLLPLMTNCPAVKHQSNVFFDFTSVDNSLKKLIRHVGDMSSIRKICDDYIENRYMNILKDCENQLKQVNITFNLFLQNKRSTYGRFYFLSDYQLINILQHVKDARTASRYINLCFNCDQLELDNELMAGFKHRLESFRLRKTILKGETDQIFKNIEENMKNSMKLNIKALIPKLKVAPNIETQMEDYPLQVILACDRIFWTQMSEMYLNTTSFNEYKLLLDKICEEMIEMIRKTDQDQWKRLSLRYVQMVSLKEIGLELIRDQINVHDFKWKQQIRMYLNEEQVIINQFDGKIIYNCEYYPPGEINVSTINTTRFLYETFYSCVNNKALVINGSQGQGKRHLIQEAGSYFGAYQKQIVCNSRLSQQFIMKLVQGALSSGAWLSFYEFNTLDYSVCAQLLHLVNKACSVQYRSQQYLFMFIHHQVEYQQISIYGFNHFAVYEPDKEKICAYLLEVYRFKDTDEMASKIMKFMKLIKPFLAKVMGSQFQLVKKVVTRAGERRIESQFDVNEDRLIAEAITIEIIKKQRQNKSQILSKALSSYFDIQYQPAQLQDKYQQKLETLCTMLTEKKQNIIALGQRSCKSTLIRQAIDHIQKQAIYLYGETTDNYLSGQSIESLSQVPKSKIIVYDSNWAISEWVDLITSGYLFIEGKRLILENQIIMEFRDISKSSPSFIGRCHILYLGQNIVTKMDKFHHILSIDHNNYMHIFDVFQELFGKNLQNLSQMNLIVLLNVLKSIKQAIPLKNIHRITIWILSVVDKESIWIRQYGGKHTDFTIYDSQLIANELTRFESVPSTNYNRYLIAPTKQIALSLDVIALLHQLNLAVHLEGPPQSGKTSLLGLITKRYGLSSKKSPHQWSQFIKNKYTYVRKQGRNVLVDLQKEGHKIIVDDLDLGSDHHYQYLRVLIQTSSFRDHSFKQYSIQIFKLLTSSRLQERKGKFWSNVVVLPLKEISKQSVETIFQINLNKQINEYSMNRQVQQLIQGNIMKAVLIAHDDLSNSFGINSSSGLLLGLLRNLLSLPKRQAYISNTNYFLFFKTMCLSKLNEKSLSKRKQWQIKSISENIFKVVFGLKDIDEQDKFLCIQGQFKAVPRKEIKMKIQQLYPNIISFDKLLNNIIYLINQLRCMDKRIVLLGKKGTGKRLILQICCKISGIRLCYDLSSAIIAAVNNERVVLVDSLQKEQSFYEDLEACETDKDLQRHVSVEMKERFHSRAAGQNSNEARMLQKCKNMIIFALTGTITSFQRFTLQNREGLNMPVCYIEEWPPEALLNIYSAEDSYANMHAQIYVSVNKILSNHNLPPSSLKYFEKYLKLYTEIFKIQNDGIKSKIKLHENIHFRFNQSSSMVSAWEARVQILKTEIEGTIKKSKETIMTNQLYSFALSIFYKQIKGQEQKYAQQTDQLKKMTQGINKKIILLEKVLKKIEKIVSSFQRTELGEFKKIYKQNSLIYFGAECLCILLGQENTEQKSINRILADPNLLMRMKAGQILTERNAKLQAKFTKEYSQMQNEIRQNTNELAKTLIEWLRSILQYWQTNHQLKSEESKQAMAKSALQKSTKRHDQLYKQVTDTKKLIEEKNIVIHQHEKIKEQKEIEYNSISGRLSNAQKIIPILKHQQQQTKKKIGQLANFRDNLRGNAILTAFTAIFLPLQPLYIKQKLLEMAKAMLRKSIISFSSSFMAEISGEKIDSLPSLNFYLLNKLSLAKLVIDPHRKFLNYLQINASQEIREGVLQYTTDTKQFQQGKIYHSTDGIKQNKQNLLIIDWEALVLEEKDAIFLSIAEFKKPQYFFAKNQLEIQINRNIHKLGKMKENLYEVICERQMKVIDDQHFIENGQQLQKLEDQTQKLRKQAEQKIKEIQELTNSINAEVKEIINIFGILKHFRKVDLELMLNICRQSGNTIENFIRWSLANIKQHHRNAFLLSIIVGLKRQKELELVKDIINQAPLKIAQGKMKKPPNISSKHWEIILKLSEYSPNFKKLMENIIKNQLPFQRWCIDPISHILPEELGVNLQFSELWMLLHHIKPKVTAYIVHKLISKELNYDLRPLPNKEIIQIMNTKFPVIVHGKLDYIIKLSKQLNESRFNSVRISKIKGEVQMKRIVWKSMQAKEWFICHDICSKKDIQMMEDICYYVMNYDKQAGFRIFIVVDTFLSRSETNLQKLIKTSTFISSNSIQLYQQPVSCDLLIQQYPMQYQISHNKVQSMTNKHIFNILFKLITICFTALRLKYPQLRHLSFKKLVDCLQFIKFKNITVQFNVFTIVQYLSRITSHVVTDPIKRRQIEEIWEHIVDESKMGKPVLHGIHLDADKYDTQIIENHDLIGCTQSHYIRHHHSIFKQDFEILSKIFNLHPSKEEVLAFVRTQLGRTPIQISHKEFTNTFNYYYQLQIMRHNQRACHAKNTLEEINSVGTDQSAYGDTFKLEYDKIQETLSKVSKAVNAKLMIHSFKADLANAISRLRKQHEFILYFNPSLPMIAIDPNSIYNMDMLLSTYVIHQMHGNKIKNGEKWLLMLEFTDFALQKELIDCHGLFLSNLQSQEFVYNKQMRTIDPSYEIDGHQTCPIMKIFLKEVIQTEETKQDTETIQIMIAHRNDKPQLNVECTAVYREWGLRDPKFLII